MDRDLAHIAAQRARRAYELARANRALLRAAVLAVPLGAAVGWSGTSPQNWSMGAGLLAIAWFAWFWGRSAGRAVWTGFAGGAVVWGMATWAGSCCSACAVGEPCMTTPDCFVACALGGLVAGILLVRTAARLQRPLEGAAVAATIALLTGAIGCSCVGTSGVVGAAVGLAMVCVPWAGLHRLMDRA